MKQFWLMFGQTGARLARTLLLWLSSGADPEAETDLLLADTDTQDTSAAKAARLGEAYTAVRALSPGLPCPGALTLRRWPERMAESGITSFSDGSEGDRLLLQAFFTPQEQRDSLRGGFRGPGEVAEAVMADLMRRDPEDALHRQLGEMRRLLDAGESVRVTLCGCTEGGMGRAGLRRAAVLLSEALAPYGERAVLTALTVLPGAEPEEAAQQAEALLPEGFHILLSLENLDNAEQCSAWDLLSVREALDGFPERIRSVSGPEGPFGWNAFGKKASAYRLALGRLCKTAACFPALAESAAASLANPRFLRDRMQGWYRAYFVSGRGAAADRGTAARELEAVSELLKGCAEVLREMDATLPPRWRYAGGIGEAYRAADAHYSQLLELAAQASVMRREAREAGLQDEQVIHRRGMEETEAEAALRRLQLVEEEVERLREEQRSLHPRLGPRLTAAMLRRREKQCRLEAEQLRAEAAEAASRIEQAARVAAPEEMYRVETARTKLQRMERRVRMLDARVRICHEDRSALITPVFDPDPAWGRDGWLFHEDAMRACFGGDRRAMEEKWTGLVADDTTALNAALRSLPGLRNDRSPAGALFGDLFAVSLREVR